MFPVPTIACSGSIHRFHRYSCSTRRFVLIFAWCYFVLVFFSPLSIAITSLWEERANLRAFRTFVRFALVWFCLFPLPLGFCERLRLVIVALPGLFSYLYAIHYYIITYSYLSILGDHNLSRKFRSAPFRMGIACKKANRKS